jgi:hypothetical protein
MSPIFYKILHLTGVLMVFLAYGGLIVRSMLQSDDRLIRKLGAITSGVGLLLILVGGFGLLAKVYGNAFPLWVILKIVIWVVLGGLIVVINRKPELGRALWWATLLLGFLATVLGLQRPF